MNTRPTPQQVRRCQIVAGVALVAFIFLVVAGPVLYFADRFGLLDLLRKVLS